MYIILVKTRTFEGNKDILSSKIIIAGRCGMYDQANVELLITVII
jgi:hypothetical protein